MLDKVAVPRQEHSSKVNLITLWLDSHLREPKDTYDGVEVHVQIYQICKG